MYPSKTSIQPWSRSLHRGENLTMRWAFKRGHSKACRLKASGQALPSFEYLYFDYSQWVIRNLRHSSNCGARSGSAGLCYAANHCHGRQPAQQRDTVRSARRGPLLIQCVENEINWWGRVQKVELNRKCLKWQNYSVDYGAGANTIHILFIKRKSDCTFMMVVLQLMTRWHVCEFKFHCDDNGLGSFSMFWKSEKE